MAREIRRESEEAARASLRVQSTYITSTPYQQQINHLVSLMGLRRTDPGPRTWHYASPGRSPSTGSTTKTAREMPTDLQIPFHNSAKQTNARESTGHRLVEWRWLVESIIKSYVSGPARQMKSATIQPKP